MALASLYNVPSTDTERSQWAFAHMAHHRDINRKIYELLAIALPEFILDPINLAETGTWEYQHQEMHNNQNSILGIAGFDLSELDWGNQNQLAGWIFLQGQEHREAATILEID